MTEIKIDKDLILAVIEKLCTKFIQSDEYQSKMKTYTNISEIIRGNIINNNNNDKEKKSKQKYIKEEKNKIKKIKK